MAQNYWLYELRPLLKINLKSITLNWHCLHTIAYYCMWYYYTVDKRSRGI